MAFRRAHPRIDIRLVIGNTAQVAEAIETGAADLGFVEGAVASAQLISGVVARDQLVLVTGPDHPWGQRAWVQDAGPEPRDLLESDWVLRESGSGTRSVFEQALSGFGVEPGRLRVALELPSNEAVRAAVEAGLGATALSASVAAPSLESGLLRHVPFRLPEREFHVLRHGQRSPSRLAEALLTMFEPSAKSPAGLPDAQALFERNP